MPAPAYGSRLAGEIRRQEPLRQLDSFLVAGLIEARSHERMALLAEHSPDPELRELYGDLLASEARHFGLYWLLCEQHWPREVIIPRLEALAAVEVEALSGELARPEDVRMHSVGVQPPARDSAQRWIACELGDPALLVVEKRMALKQGRSPMSNQWRVPAGTLSQSLRSHNTCSTSSPMCRQKRPLPSTKKRTSSSLWVCSERNFWRSSARWG